MALKKKAVTGMKDILPGEMEIRQYVLSVIRRTYARFGFTEIETPVVEHLANLQSRQGGENEKLIFKILKRGEKLESVLRNAAGDKDKAFQNGEPIDKDTRYSSNGLKDKLSEEGLRYDLTVPLARFYSENQANLMSPFKALQIGPVFRADRPQKGRYRQFFQCDIDVFGDSSNLSEIELILAIGSVLSQIGFDDCRIVINDREILKGMHSYAGFPDKDFERVCVSLDKTDKIGFSGVREELLSEGFSAEAIDRYESLIADLDRIDKENEVNDEDITDLHIGDLHIRELGEKLKGFIPEAVTENLLEIIRTVRKVNPELKIEFDPSLVRGMGYYTGPVFEIRAKDFPGSVGGGGRYDHMVAGFTGQEVPAVGFSIGFERIIYILMEEGFKVPGNGEKTAILMDRKLGFNEKMEAIEEAQRLRGEGKTVLLSYMNKNRKFQKEKLRADGYTDIRERFK